MNQEMGEEILTALDLGTTKIFAIVGLAKAGNVTVLGTGEAPSHGMRKGTVVDIESTVESIRAAVNEAEQQAGAKSGLVYASVGGSHIRAASSEASITISNKDHEIMEEDFRRVVEHAQNISLPSDHEILHAIVQEFSVDNQDGIRNPVGMCGTKLVARIRIVTGAITCVQNVIRAVQRAGCTFGGLILQALASEKPVLTHEERELGVVCMDLGGGTTDVAVIIGKGLWHTGVITMGGNLITRDIAFGLRVPFAAAEEMKRKAGACLASEVRDDELVDIPATGQRQGRSVPRRALARIIEPRIEEIFEQVREQLRQSGCAEEQLGGGLVLTGGCVHLPYIAEKAEQIFEHLSVRIGDPMRLPGSPETLALPQCATAVGLLMEAAEQRRHALVGHRRSLFKGGLKWLKDLFHEN